MDFNKYRQTAQEIEDNFIENGRSYEDALNKTVIDVFGEMEEDYKQEQSEQLIITDVVNQRELLRTEVFKLANKLAINGYGNEAVKMHHICNGM